MNPPKDPTYKKARKAKEQPTATALHYKSGETEAPQVVATGRGKLADRIIALAEAHDIPLVNDPALAQTLAKLELNTEIPPNLYLAVAQILAYVYRLDQELGPARAPSGR
jgi:flagellar biosynthesis protein